jgi:hypothetical protein
MKRLSMDDVTNILTDYGKPEAPHGLPFVRFRPTGPGTNGQTYIIEATTDYGSFRVYATFDEDGSRTNFSADVGAPSRWESVAKVNWPSIGARTARTKPRPTPSTHAASTAPTVPPTDT